MAAGIGTGPAALFPDLVLLSQDRGHRLQAIVEIETGESVNHLEALAQWAHYGRVRAAFHLYVPAGMVDVARRLTEDNQIHVAEIWSYHVVGDEPRFTLVHRNKEAISAQAKARPKKLPRYIAVDTAKDERTVPQAAKSVVIFDTETQEVVGNNVYDVKSTPPVGGTAKFETYTAEYVGTGG